MSIQVTIKPIKGEQFKVDIDGTLKVSDLKTKIAEAKAGEFPAEAQKLIFQGKILQDDTVVNDIGLKPDTFVVCMVANVKKPAEAAAPAATPTPTAAPAAVAPAAPAAAPAPTGPPPLPTMPAVLTDLKSNPKWGELARMVARDPGVLNR